MTTSSATEASASPQNTSIKGSHNKPNNVMLRLATQPQEAVFAQLNNYAAWGKKLTTEQYLERESTIASSNMSKNGLHTWLLVENDGKRPETDPVGSQSEILCACETYERAVYYTHGDGQVHEGLCHSVASVFTPEMHRKKGYATEMMNLLHKKMIAKPGVVASNLYSDVGPVFYNRLGWKLYPSFEAWVDVSTSAPSSNNVTTTFIDSSTSLDTVLAQDLATQQSKLKSTNTPAAYIPCTTDTFFWFLQRAKFYAKQFEKPVPTRFGCFVSNAFAIWHHDFKDNHLYIIKLSYTSAEQLAALVSKAVEEARGYGLSHVLIWEPKVEDFNGLSNFKVEIKEREDSLSSLLVLNEKLEGGPMKGDVTWVCNEKYAWV